MNEIRAQICSFVIPLIDGIAYQSERGELFKLGGIMPVCTYDNPKYWRRECWQDGRLVCWYSFGIFLFRDAKIAPESLFFGANIGPWREGQIVGDERAMKKSPDMPGAYQSP